MRDDAAALLRSLGARARPIVPRDGTLAPEGVGETDFEALLRSVSVGADGARRLLDPERLVESFESFDEDRLGELVDKAESLGVRRAVAILPEGQIIIDVATRIIDENVDTDAEVVTGIDGVLRLVEHQDPPLQPPKRPLTDPAERARTSS